MGELVVVRHGQASLLSADYDRLSALGVQQGRMLGEHWASAGVTFKEAFMGPARRHRGTAEQVGDAMREAGRDWPEVELLQGLDEHDAFGLVTHAIPILGAQPAIARMQAELAGAEDRKTKSRAFQRLFEAVMLRWIDGELDDPEIESWSAFRDRVDAALAQMLEGSGSGRRVVVFTSVGPIAVMLGRALGTEPHQSFETAWRVRNCSVTTFLFGKGRLTLDGFNALPHLPDPSTHTFR